MVEIGIASQARKDVVAVLEKILANEYLLYTKTLKFHWNVEGKHFGALHLFFREQYEELFGIVDDVAERIRTLGHASPGTLAEFVRAGTLKEAVGENPDDLGMIRLLLLDHEEVIRQVRKAADLVLEHGDIGTNNFLIDLLEKQEKRAWMLRAHLGTTA